MTSRKFKKYSLRIYWQAWQALPLASHAIHQALKEDLTLRGTAKIGEDTEYKKISDLQLNISDDVIEDIKVTLIYSNPKHIFFSI